MSKVTISVSQGIATITFNRPTTLNAITAEDYEAFSCALRDIDKRDDVVVTVWQATGKWFCAYVPHENLREISSLKTRIFPRGTDLKASKPPAPTLRHQFLERVAATNTETSQALYSHGKILVAALNGPVMGIAAAFLGHFDFIYCMPEAWLSVPFTFLGLVSEGGASALFMKRMGLAKANEALIWGKKLSSQELLACGFINQIFPQQPVESFHASVREHLLEQLSGLEPTAVLGVKKTSEGWLKGTKRSGCCEHAGKP
ncbi:hypothetical protein EW146_g7404 [Bondarzewia mesenterica]|uniref:Uncharacterized protein n=1 Tax=Bondarzewia mesenterica TaxID=1095465 RepID=A0A4S4LLE7_9AGAM|nr:hypothetical protein EW146_g7404 [Bondarzewia mesenterica]